MPADLIVPPVVEQVIQEFERTDQPFTQFAVQRQIVVARDSLKNPSEAERLGVWAELLAFGLSPPRIGSSPWNTYFGPMASSVDQAGNPTYHPDIAGTNPVVLQHWSRRAKQLTQPKLVARYADLAWDMSWAIGNSRRDPEMAKIAIDAYLKVATAATWEIRDRFDAAFRALELAALTKDQQRISECRAVVLALHRETIHSEKGLWWEAFDHLMGNKRAGVTIEEQQHLVADLEGLVHRFGDQSDPKKFDPHSLEMAAKRLIKHYRRTKQFDEAKRLWQIIARTFEHVASLTSSSLLASSFLQTAVSAYQSAGLPKENERSRVEMQNRITQSRSEMKTIETSFEISREDMDKFLSTIVVEQLGDVFVRMAIEFLPKRARLEDEIRKTSEKTPLLALMPLQIMAEDHVAAKIGSVDDDLLGRVIQQTATEFEIADPWIEATFERMIEVHDPTPHHFASWANRHRIFDDLGLVIEGVSAWFESDWAKAVHVLIPQIESGLRAIVAQLGKPVTKAHSTLPGVSVAIGMGDVLNSPEVTAMLGPNLTLYFLALYADPRGLNLRNRVAHGLLKANHLNLRLTQILLHTLLVFGMWKELVERDGHKAE